MGAAGLILRATGVLAERHGREYQQAGPALYTPENRCDGHNRSGYPRPV